MVLVGRGGYRRPGAHRKALQSMGRGVVLTIRAGPGARWRMGTMGRGIEAGWVWGVRHLVGLGAVAVCHVGASGRVGESGLVGVVVGRSGWGLALGGAQE